ncbi:MAG: sulfotransferase [Phycisphaerales bacterium]
MSQDWITIVSGLPRSGTSMMMRMVVAAGTPVLTDALRPADEDNPHGYFEFEPVKRTRQDPSWLDQARGRVVKMVHLLLLDLPHGHDYRVIMMHRDLDEVIASQAKMLARFGRAGAPAEMLRRVYTAQLQQVKARLATHPRLESIEVGYSEVLRDPAGQSARVAGFLGVAGGAAAMAGAVDRSLYRNRIATVREPRISDQ